jgi:hypothetical protein
MACWWVWQAEALWLPHSWVHRHGFSRRLIWLKVSRTNNDPAVVAGFFFEAVQYGGPQVQCTKQNPTTQNKIPLHKTKFTIHKTQFHNTKPNFATQNKIPLHETKFHYTKLDSTTQNSIHDTQNKIPLHKTQFTTHKTQFHYTKLYSTTQNSIHDAQLSRESAGKWHD